MGQMWNKALELEPAESKYLWGLLLVLGIGSTGSQES